MAERLELGEGGDGGAAEGAASELVVVYEPLLEEVHRRAGLAFSSHREPLVLADLERLRGELAIPSVDAFVQAFLRSPEVSEQVLSTLTVSETYFFREPAQLGLLRDQLLPQRLMEVRSGPARVWSAGCATGEEPYSVAMMAREAGLHERVRVFGTDLNRGSLARARDGRYRPWSFRGVGADLQARYFQPEGSYQVLDPEIRAQVTLFPLNLVHPVPSMLTVGLWNLDVVLCRNVLLYLSPEAQRVAFFHLVEALAPGGWLLLGASDPLPPEYLPVDPEPGAPGLVFRRRSTLTRAEPTFRSAPAPEPPRPRPPRRVAPLPGTATSRLEAVARNYGAVVALQRAQDEGLEDPADPEVLYMQGILQLELDRPALAVAVLRLAVQRAPGLIAAHYLLGLAAEQAGERARARQAFRVARQLALACNPEAEVPLTGGERAGALAAAAMVSIAGLDDEGAE